MAMDLQAPLVAPLGDMLDDFLHCEIARVLHQAAELEAAMKLHQARMKEVAIPSKHTTIGWTMGITSLNSPYNAGIVESKSPPNSTGAGI